MIATLGGALERVRQRIEPSLGDREAAYRQHYLRHDVDQATLGMALLTAPLILLAPSDYILFGATAPFALLILLRLACLLFMVTLAWRLRHVRSYTAYDRLINVWAVGGLAAILAVNLTRPPAYTQHIGLDAMVVLAGYLIIPNRLSGRLLIAVGFSLITACLYLTGQRVADALSTNLVWVTLALTNVIGIAASCRFYALRRRQYVAMVKLEQAHDELRLMATTDPLTGLLNRRRLFELAKEELARARRYDRPLSVAILDLDHFKQVNDRLGHATGDAVLRAFADVLRQETRRQDRVGRSGGEEFVVILPETPLGAARDLAERIRERVRRLDLAVDGTDVRVTVSLGVAELSRADRSIDDILKRADRALYAAKRGGRDRVAAA